MFTLSIVVAMAENRVIGKDNTLPWRLSEDLKHFKAVTMGYPIIMGRKTFDSIGRPLPGRTNIVVTRQNDWKANGVEVVNDLDAAIALAQTVAQNDGKEQAMLVGGGQLYEQALPRCNKLYLTQVHAQVEGDAYFPVVEFAQWRELSRTRHEAKGDDSYAYSFVELERLS